MLFPEKVNLQTIEEPHLVTIPYSHYCELGRWALEYAGMEFREVKYAPGYHAKMVGELRKDRANRSRAAMWVKRVVFTVVVEVWCLALFTGGIHATVGRSPYAPVSLTQPGHVIDRS